MQDIEIQINKVPMVSDKDGNNRDRNRGKKIFGGGG